MRVGRLAAVAAGVFGLAAVSAATGLAPKPPSPAQSADAGIVVRPGVIHIARKAQAAPLTTAGCEKDYNIACYGVAQVRRAYGLPALYANGVTGRGATIVIVDSYGSPTIQNDLSAFDRAYRLPAPPKFQIIRPAGRIPAYDPASSDMVGWPARPRWTWSGPTRSRRGRTSCWSRRRSPRPRACTASRRSSRPRSTCSTTTSAT